MEDFIELTGTVIFIKENNNSKSEIMQPCLYVNQKQVERLFMKDSNPFENNELQKMDGKFVTVRGYKTENKFVIHEISERKNDR